MRLYAGEILSMHCSNIIKYKLFRTYSGALDWCIEHANYRTKTMDGKPRPIAAYDKTRCLNVDYYSDDRCKGGFFLWGYFAVMEIEI